MFVVNYRHYYLLWFYISLLFLVSFTNIRSHFGSRPEFPPARVQRGIRVCHSLSGPRLPTGCSRYLTLSTSLLRRLIFLAVGNLCGLGFLL